MLDDSEFLRKKPKQSRSQSVVTAVIDAAEQLLERTGDPASLSLQGIARRAGVGIGSLYDYFANRDGLLGAWLLRMTRRNFEALEREVAATRGRRFDDALPELLDAVLRTYLERPAVTRAAIHGIAVVGWIRPVVSERDRFAHVLAARLCDEHPGVDAAKARLTAEVLCDAAMGVVMGELWRARDERGRAAVRDELLRVARLQIRELIAEAGAR